MANSYFRTFQKLTFPVLLFCETYLKLLLKKIAPLKSRSLHCGKHSKLIIQSVTSSSKDVLSGKKHKMGDVSILFPFINRNDLLQLKLRHIYPFKRLVDYGTKHNVELCEAGVVMYSSNISYSQLLTIADKYRILPVYYLIAPNRYDRANLPPRGYIMVYREQLRAGHRFPLYPLIQDILMYWNVALAQLSPNFIR